MLRRGEMKYSRAAASDLTAHASLDEAARDKYSADLVRRGRALVRVSVELRDAEGNTASTGMFEWYVERTSAASPGNQTNGGGD